MTTVVKRVVYDEHSTADSMAGYDSLSEVNVRGLKETLLAPTS